MLRFHRIPSASTILFPDLIWKMPETGERSVYLTFDDGPMPGPTDFVLDVLKDYDGSATFFCIGNNIRKHPQTFNRILQDGHSVGNHTDHHISGWNTSSELYRRDIDECEKALEGSNTNKLFRPPFGKLPFYYKKILSDKQIIMWDLLTYDFDPALPVQRALENIKRLTRPGSIVVFHDSLKAEKNLKYMLPPYLDFLNNEGYSLKSIR